MSGINKVILIGHIGKEPEFRYLIDKVPVLTFPPATSDTFMKNGVNTEQTEWHNIVMWRGLAESAARVPKKGALIFIEGKARTRSFIDKENNKKYSTEIIADHFTPLGRKSDFEEIAVTTEK